MSDISCRLATTADLVAIQNLVQSRVIPKDEVNATGLRGYRVPTLEKYSFRLNTGTIFVAHSSDLLVGFADSYPSEKISTLFPNDPVVKFIQSKVSQPFVYNNTIVVHKDFEGRGVSSTLMLARFSQYPNQSFATAIVEEPARNEKSISLMRRFNFYKIGQIGHIVPFEDYSFGIYFRQGRKNI